MLKEKHSAKRKRSFPRIAGFVIATFVYIGFARRSTPEKGIVAQRGMCIQINHLRTSVPCARLLRLWKSSLI
jgi:hypothetical protein